MKLCKSMIAAILCLALLSTQGNSQDIPNKCVASPISIRKEWLGYVMKPDMSGPTNHRAIHGKVSSMDICWYGSNRMETGSEFELRACVSGFGSNISGSANDNLRRSMFTVFYANKVEQFDAGTTSTVKELSGYVPVKVYYGWSYNIIAEGKASIYTVDVAARIFAVNGDVKGKANAWKTDLKLSARGLKPVGDKIVCAVNEADIKTNFTFDQTQSHPILVEYEK